MTEPLQGKEKEGKYQQWDRPGACEKLNLSVPQEDRAEIEKGNEEKYTALNHPFLINTNVSNSQLTNINNYG